MKELYNVTKPSHEISGKNENNECVENSNQMVEFTGIEAQLNEEFGNREIPTSMEIAQKSIEAYYDQSVRQILETNGKYMSEADKARIARGVDGITAIEYNPSAGYSGLYSMENGKGSIEIVALDQMQMERSTKHETNHFASKNSEIAIPDINRNGYTVYRTVGVRQSRWFHSNETGIDSEYVSKGRGLNEGITTLYTNQQLAEISKEKGEAAVRQGIYYHATELCGQLERIVGSDTMKKAYYGGNIEGLKEKVDSLAGENGFENLRDCIDRTISPDYAERVEAMKEAQKILAKMYENGGYE